MASPTLINYLSASRPIRAAVPRSIAPSTAPSALIADHNADAAAHPLVATAAAADATAKANSAQAAAIAASDPLGTASAAVAAHAGGSGVHAIAGVSGLQTVLDGKEAAGVASGLIATHVSSAHTATQILATLTGSAVLAAGSMLYGDGDASPATLALGTAGRLLVAGASAPAWSDTGLSYTSGLLKSTTLSIGGNNLLTTFAGSTVTPALQAANTTADGTAIGLARFSSSAAATGPTIYLNRSSGATVGDYAATVATRRLGQVVFGGSDGTDFATAASIRGLCDGTVLNDAVPGRIEAYTANASGTEVLTLTLNSAQQTITPNGTAALPALGIGGANLGLAKIAANNVSTCASGVEVLRMAATSAVWSMNASVAIGTTPITATNGIIKIFGTDGVQMGLRQYAFGNNASNEFARYNGTAAAPTKVVSGDSIYQEGINGYQETTATLVGAMLSRKVTAAEDWTSTAAGWHQGFYSCPVGSTTSAERWRVTPSGPLMGGATLTPLSGFDAGTITPYLQVFGANVSGSSAALMEGNNSTAAPVFYLAKSRGTLGSYTAVVTGDPLGRLSVQGADGTDLAEAYSLTISCEGTTAANQVPGVGTEKTASALGTMTQARRVDSSQNHIFGPTDPGGTARVRIDGAIRTSQGGMGAAGADWRLGSIRTATVAAVTSEYLEVEIGGVVKKIQLCS